MQFYGFRKIAPDPFTVMALLARLTFALLVVALFTPIPLRAGHPNAAAAFGSHARLPRMGARLGTPPAPRRFATLSVLVRPCQPCGEL